MYHIARFAKIVTLVSSTFGFLAGCGGGGGNAAAGINLINVSATISWAAPTSNADGSALVAGDVAGYRIYYRAEGGAYSIPVTAAGALTSYTVTLTSVPAGRYFFAVTAYDMDGNESDYSQEFSRVF